jgi:hypothetical protein
MLKRHQPKTPNMAVRSKNRRVSGASVNRSDTGVIVIGAGAAGLSAARELSRKHGIGWAVEFSPCETHHLALLSSSVRSSFTVSRRDIRDRTRGWSRPQLTARQPPPFGEREACGASGETRRIKKRNRQGDGPHLKDQSLADYLEHKKLGAESRLFCSTMQKATTQDTQGRLVSSRRRSRRGEDTRQFRIVDGYDRVIDWLATGLDPSRTDSEVEHRRYRNSLETWRGHSADQKARASFTESFCGQAVIVTVPAAAWG